MWALGVTDKLLPGTLGWSIQPLGFSSKLVPYTFVSRNSSGSLGWGGFSSLARGRLCQSPFCHLMGLGGKENGRVDSAHCPEGMSQSALLSRPCVVETRLSWPSRQGRRNSPPTLPGCPRLVACTGAGESVCSGPSPSRGRRRETQRFQHPECDASECLGATLHLQAVISSLFLNVKKEIKVKYPSKDQFMQNDRFGGSCSWWFVY